MKRKFSIAVLIALLMLMLLLLSSMLVRGCPSSRHGYQTEVLFNNPAVLGKETVKPERGVDTISNLTWGTLR